MRDYKLPEKRQDESNAAWCRRAAESIPAESICRQLVMYLLRREKQRKAQAWSVMGQITGHGSGVASAIVDRFQSEEEQ
jgi:hypothetical protein